MDKLHWVPYFVCMTFFGNTRQRSFAVSLHGLMVTCVLAESLCICSRPHECGQDCSGRVCLCPGHAALYQSSVHIPHQDHLQSEIPGLYNRQIRGKDLSCSLADWCNDGDLALHFIPLSNGQWSSDIGTCRRANLWLACLQRSCWV